MLTPGLARAALTQDHRYPHHRRPRRGTFTSVDELSDAIATWVEHWNSDPQPFIWKAADWDIITKVHRGRDTRHQINSRTEHSFGEL